MSWTLYATHDDPDLTGIKLMMDAIGRAEKKNIIMFCAAQDNGFQAHRDPYPAKSCNPKTMKRIGSAGLHGERSGYVHPKEVDYLFPGEVAMSSENICTGSSASTALASGLAGLILWCCAFKKSDAALGDIQKLRRRSKTLFRGLRHWNR